jgi:hypothetical protein
MRFTVSFSPFNHTDLGQSGPSAADVTIFHDELSQDGTTVGDEVGSCVVIEPTDLSNCTGVIRLEGRGTLAFAFLNAPPPHKEPAITEGSASSDPSAVTGRWTRAATAPARWFCVSSRRSKSEPVEAQVDDLTARGQSLGARTRPIQRPDPGWDSLARTVRAPPDFPRVEVDARTPFCCEGVGLFRLRQ